MYQRRLHDLMVVLPLPVALVPLQAQVAVNAFAVEVLRAVKGHQILGRVKLIRFQFLATLQTPEVFAEYPLQGLIVVFIQNLTKLRVCRNRPHSEDGAQIVALNLLLKASLKLKQGGVLQVEHREGAAIAVLHLIGNAGRSTRIGDQIRPFSQGFQ